MKKSSPLLCESVFLCSWSQYILREWYFVLGRIHVRELAHNWKEYSLSSCVESTSAQVVEPILSCKDLRRTVSLFVVNSSADRCLDKDYSAELALNFGSRSKYFSSGKAVHRLPSVYDFKVVVNCDYLSLAAIFRDCVNVQIIRRKTSPGLKILFELLFIMQVVLGV